MRWFRFVLLSLLLVILGVVCVFVLAHSVQAQNNNNDDTKVIKVKRDGHEFQTKIVKEVSDPDEGRPSRAGSLLVKFRPVVSQSEQDKVHKAAGALKVERLYLGNTQRVSVSRNNVAQALAVYRNNFAVTYAVPDRIVHTLFTPNDPRFGDQWGMSKINAPGAWDFSTIAQLQHGSLSLIVAFMTALLPI